MIEALYSKVILRFSKLVLVLASLLVIVFGYYATKLEIDASAKSLLIDGDKDLEFSRQVSKRYKTNDFLVLTFSPKNGDLLSDSSLKSLRGLSDDLLKMKIVSSTTSILNAPLLQSSDKSLKEILDDIPTLSSKGIDKQKAKKEFLNSPIYKNHLVSEDFTTTAILVNLIEDKRFFLLQNQIDDLKHKQKSAKLTQNEKQKLENTQKEFKTFRDTQRTKNHNQILQIRNVIEKYKNSGTIHLGGINMIADDMVTFLEYDIKTFGLIVFVLLIFILFVLFKEIKWVVVPVTICTASVVLTSGILGYLGWEITVVSSNFISMQLIMTMSLAIHLIIKYKELLSTDENHTQEYLVLNTVKSMAKPSFFVVITTIAGFSSLVFSDMLPVINFGYMMAIGISISLITTFVLFPAIAMQLPRGKYGIKKSTKKPISFYIAKFVQNNKKTILFGAVLTVIFSLTGASKLYVENSFIDYFKSDTEIHKGMTVIDKKLGGTTPLDVVITFVGDTNEIEKIEVIENPNYAEQSDDLDDFEDEFEDTKDDVSYWFTSNRVDVINKVHKYLEGVYGVGKVLSLSTMFELAKSLNDNKDLTGFELGVLYKAIPQKYKAMILDPYLNIQNNEARITLRIKDSLPNLRRNELINTINTDLSNMLDIKNESFRLSNLLVIYNNMLQSLFDSQIKTLGIVVFILFLMFLAVFKSFYIAIIAIIANIVPVGVIFGVMGWLNIPLDMMTITIAAISLGIAVDDTIHYIHRFQLEYAKSGDYLVAMYNSHNSIGTAMFYTSVVIMTGFSVLVVSAFMPTVYFGMLTLVAMFMAIVSDLLLLPAMILLFKPYKKKNTKTI